MTSRPHPFRSNKLLAGLVLLIAAVISGLGALYIFDRYVPETYGRHGAVGPFHDQAAQQVGLGMIILGLLPLCLFVRTARGAAWSATIVLIAVMLNIFVGHLVWS